LCAQHPTTLGRDSLQPLLRTEDIRLTEKEYARLSKYADKAGLPKITYIRHMINGCCPTENPSKMSWALINELHSIGDKLNQLKHITHRIGSLDADRLDRVLTDFNRFSVFLYNQIMLPERVDISATLSRGYQLAVKEQSMEIETSAEKQGAGMHV
jgi:hypothetical protein